MDTKIAMTLVTGLLALSAAMAKIDVKVKATKRTRTPNRDLK
jgi:hypothetical protein